MLQVNTVNVTVCDVSISLCGESPLQSEFDNYHRLQAGLKTGRFCAGNLVSA